MYLQMFVMKTMENYMAITHRIHGAAIHGNMDPINIPQMLAYIPYMDPMGMENYMAIIQ